ncbi:MAG: hypothetical protein J0H89_06805, partial [Rhizobiales bacterium]|nr:hypothetical protein [Hyphomicrobiales bacterium]
MSRQSAAKTDYLIRGSRSNWWNGGGDDNVHSNVVAPSPHGFAAACVFLMKAYSDRAIINIGTGEDIAISEFARVVAGVVGYTGRIVYDTSRPDGMPRKLVDVSRLNAMGWSATIGLEQGL